MNKKHVAKFTAGNQHMLIVAQEGKSGWNVKTSIKEGKGKGAPRAQTGCRSNHKTEKEALSALQALVGEAKQRGWAEESSNARNAFNEIPAPPKEGNSGKKKSHAA